MTTNRTSYDYAEALSEGESDLSCRPHDFGVCGQVLDLVNG